MTIEEIRKNAPIGATHYGENYSNTENGIVYFKFIDATYWFNGDDWIWHSPLHDRHLIELKLI